MIVVDALKNTVNLLTSPAVFITLAIVLFFASLRYRQWWRPRVALGVGVASAIFVAVSMLDRNFLLIVKKPDNVPIVAMLFLVGFFWWLAMHQAFQNDERIAQGLPPREASDGENEKTWVWPDLVYTEMLCMILGTIVLVVWGLAFHAPIEEAANPARTPNPSKAPWYFLGLQEMLVYYDPWLAGVVFPSLIIVGLMAIPYIDVNPKGNGYYTFKQRRFALWMFGWGFLMWIILIVIGTFIRGPGWIWFWPGQTWDHNTVVFDRNRDVHEIVGLTVANFPNYPTLMKYAVIPLFGFILVAGFYLIGGLFFHWWMMRAPLRPRYFKSWTALKNWATVPGEFERKLLANTTLLQYLTFQFFAISVLLAMPVKLILRLVFTIKYVWVTPWFNV